MSGHGAPDIDLSTDDASGLRVAVVASSWHTEIMDGLVDGARRALADAGVRDAPVVRVPGSFLRGARWSYMNRPRRTNQAGRMPFS